jgi:predicted DNA-binding protein
MEKSKSENEVVYPLRLNRTDYERLKLLAREEDLNGAQFVRRAIRQAIERRQKRAHTESDR